MMKSPSPPLLLDDPKFFPLVSVPRIFPPSDPPPISFAPMTPFSRRSRAPLQTVSPGGYFLVCVFFFWVLLWFFCGVGLRVGRFFFFGGFFFVGWLGNIFFPSFFSKNFPLTHFLSPFPPFEQILSPLQNRAAAPPPSILHLFISVSFFGSGEFFLLGTQKLHEFFSPSPSFHSGSFPPRPSGFRTSLPIPFSPKTPASLLLGVCFFEIPPLFSPPSTFFVEHLRLYL